MGLFSSLFSGSTKHLSRATAEANKQLSKASKTARGEINAGIDQQLASLNQGYQGATGALTSGFDSADQRLTQGYGGAESAINTQLDYTKQLFDPYLQAGTAAQGRYNDALGLNGQGAATSFYDQYATSDPYRQLNEDMANRAMARSFNAGGRLASGGSALAASRANLERGSTDLNNYLNRLSGQAQQGQQAAGTVAGFANQAGTNVANLRTGLGTQLANNATNRGAAMGNLAYGYGQDQGTIQANRGAQNANLTYGTAQQIAGNRINLGNARQQQGATAANNLLQLAGTVGGAAIGGFTPGTYGVSAFGNLRNGMSGKGIV